MLKLTDLNLDHIDEGLYDLEVSYYELEELKIMGDGAVFEKGTVLRRLSKTDRDGLFFVETTEGDKSLFWVDKEEVKLIESKSENWLSDDLKTIRKFILNDFL